MDKKKALEQCKHCWHNTSQSFGHDGTRVDNDVCCECGVHRTMHYPPPKPTEWIHTPKKHGPFFPRSDVKIDKIDWSKYFDPHIGEFQND